MYKAIKQIGGYKIGDEVPTEKALAWKDMYEEPHIEEVEDKPIAKVEETKKDVLTRVAKPVKHKFRK